VGFRASVLVKKSLQRGIFELAKSAAATMSAYHRAELHGVEQLPAGPALLVGNHGLFGYETPIFFFKILEATGRAPIGLADRGLASIPVVKEVLPWLGGVPGTRQHALDALNSGHWVVCYPGGAKEVFKHRHDRYVLQWSETLGFVRVAAEAGVPIVPFAARGIDETFVTWGASQVTARLFDTQRYAAPLPLGPLPLPTRFRFELGAPMSAPPQSASPKELTGFREEVAQRVRGMLDGMK
jgi:1-acyl-sn-glycerol-3-phosphate acyltransferase